MSLFDDILESEKVQQLIKDSDFLKKLYLAIQNRNKKRLNNLSPEELEDENYSFSEIVKKETKEMSYNDKQLLVKKLFKLDEKFPKSIDNSDYSKYNELEFFESNKNDDKETFFNKIDNTQTVLGKIQLMKTITEPKTDLNLLNERKNILEHLQNDENKLEKVLTILKDLKKSEGDVLWFYKNSTDEIDNMLSMVYFENFWNRWLNENETVLNIFYYCKLILIPLYGLLMPILLIVIPYILISKIMKLKISFKTYWKMISKMYMSGGITSTIGKFYKMYENTNSQNTNTEQTGGKQFLSFTNIIMKLVKILIDSKITSIFYYIFIIGSYLYSLYSTLNFSYAYLKVIKLFQTKLNKVSKWICKAQELYNTLGCMDCLELKEKFSNKINFMNDDSLYQLDNKVFKNNPSLILSNKGVILKQFLIVKNNPEILKSYLEYISHVDVWSSLADLNRNNPQMSLANYKEQSKHKPQIILENFYNMMVSENNSVSNSIIIGGSSNKTEKQYKDLMVTGPNASGKSTFLKAITECLILGQTVCLVPALYMDFTPYHHINTYLNIPDCQGKESLFQAEMERCYEQIESFKDMAPNEYVFSIMDEIFVSTNYYEGLSGAYAIAKKMASFDNSVCLISTHFSTLSDFCEKEKCYKNYHFSIEYDEDNKITKTYKLKEGRTKQHIALEMLEEKGFADDLVANAKKMYKHLTKPTPPPTQKKEKPTPEKEKPTPEKEQPTPEKEKPTPEKEKPPPKEKEKPTPKEKEKPISTEKIKN